MKKLLTLIIIALVIGSIWYLESQKVPRIPDSDSTLLPEVTVISNAVKDSRYEKAKEITTPDGFINTSGIKLNDEVGKKVVLIDFWTYSCINCQRTTPYLNAWYDKYRDSGLEIIGVHTPEFAFEKVLANVQEAVRKFGIQFPVVLDNDFSTWRAYRNQYWPRKYLVDIDGYIVFDHIGEGGYEETEKKIQELLAERNSRLNLALAIPSGFVNPETEKPMQGVSHETYFGASRNEFLANGKQFVLGEQEFTSPKALLNQLSLDGTWNITQEYAENRTANATIVFRYQASKVFFVASSEKPVKVSVRIDGKLVNEMAGEDVVNGMVTIQTDRLYRLIEDPSGFAEHILELEIADPGLRAFTFTFG